MDDQTLRERAEAHCQALLAGDIDRAIEDLSDELRQHIGQFVAQLPLPLSEATVESIETGPGRIAILRLVGDGGEVRMTTRWKERDGELTIVEASHVVEQPPAPASEDEATEDRE